MNDTPIAFLPDALPHALRDAAIRLATISDTPRLDAELLMAYALRCSRSAMLLRARDLEVPTHYAALIERRAAHEPVAYITGSQAFWDLELAVSPGVLIPRADSETLIEAAVAAFAGREPPAHILDLGTGSGALLLAALSCFPSAIGVGMDASVAALSVAQQNVERLGFGARAAFHHLNWSDADWDAALGGTYDLVLCNPPYVETTAALSPMVVDYEPHSALFAGTDGLDDYTIILPAIPALLAQNGRAIFEIGHTQADAVARLAKDCGLHSSLRRDLTGHPRALTIWQAPPA